jgi:putative phosphoribosyl transferase
VILVDDGLATGATMRAAIAAVRTAQPESIVVAVPVAAAITVRQLAGEADAIVCPLTPDDFYAVGAWYQDFDQVDDAQVQVLLRQARRSVGHVRDPA